MQSQFYGNYRITPKCFQRKKDTKAWLLRDTHTVFLFILQLALLGMAPWKHCKCHFWKGVLALQVDHVLGEDLWFQIYSNPREIGNPASHIPFQPRNILLVQGRRSQSVVSKPEAPQNFFEMRILRPHLRSNESETLGGGARQSGSWQTLQVILNSAQVGEQALQEKYFIASVRTVLPKILNQDFSVSSSVEISRNLYS